MSFMTLRTIPWGNGFIEKGKPVPDDVPEGLARDWEKRGWVSPVPKDLSPAAIVADDVERAGPPTPRSSRRPSTRARAGAAQDEG